MTQVSIFPFISKLPGGKIISKIVAAMLDECELGKNIPPHHPSPKVVHGPRNGRDNKSITSHFIILHDNYCIPLMAIFVPVNQDF